MGGGGVTGWGRGKRVKGVDGGGVTGWVEGRG